LAGGAGAGDVVLDVDEFGCGKGVDMMEKESFSWIRGAPPGGGGIMAGAVEDGLDVFPLLRGGGRVPEAVEGGLDMFIPRPV